MMKIYYINFNIIYNLIIVIFSETILSNNSYIKNKINEFKNSIKNISQNILNDNIV